MFGEERKITVEVLRPAALERVAQGAKVLNVKYISQEEVTNQWEALAEWWSHHIGDEGDSFGQHFLGPAIRDAIAPATGRRVLDIGCGEGILARQLADSGAEVVAIDPCPNMLHQATRKTRPGAVLYDLRAAVDAADVGKANFDTVVSNMVLMDLPDYQVAIKAIAQALRKGGQAVCSILHPHCFDPETGRWWQDAGHEDPVLFKVRREQGRWARFVRVDANAPVETFYFHRNCDDYRRAFKRVKLKITDELEPEITEGVRDAAGLPPSLPTRPLLIFVVERVG
jgi:2-polyprenyl-3-methyl-5-hydroxy-6-metoxy-1,4-benzoquinol methylase